MTGAIVGGYVSATMSRSIGTAIGVSPLSAFLGGVCLLVGARMGAGCTRYAMVTYSFQLELPLCL